MVLLAAQAKGERQVTRADENYVNARRGGDLVNVCKAG